VPKLYLIDHLLADESGHNAGQFRCLFEAALARGIEVIAVIPRSSSMIPDLGTRALPVLHSPDRTSFEACPFIAIGADNELTRQSLACLEGVSPDDYVFDLSLFHRHMYGFMSWVDSLGPRAPHVGGLLFTQECRVASTGETHVRNTGFYRDFLRWAAGRSAGVWYAFSAPDARALLGQVEPPASSIDLQGFPFMLPSLRGASAPTDTPGCVVFAYLGLTYGPGKGLRQFLSAARILLNESLDYRFVVQLATGTSRFDSGFVREEFPDVCSDPRVAILDGPLAPETFYSQMSCCDVVVLPYGPAYDTQNSGLFHEALALGKCVVLPAHSLANQLALGAGLILPTFKNWTGLAIADACKLAATWNTEKILELSRVINAGMGPDAILTRLLGQHQELEPART
jgi:hypothetical protein